MKRKRRVLVTGASGEIGTIVREDLADEYELTLVSRRSVGLPGFCSLDISSDYCGLERLLKGHDAILHLAYVEEVREETANHLMAKNIFRAAYETKPCPRVVIASSIHAVGGYDPEDGVITDDSPLIPNSIYGAFKCYVETLGRFYSTKGMEVVAVRFGGVRADNRIMDEPDYDYRSIWLSRRDCVQIIRRAIEARLPRNFVRCFAVSDNRSRVHDLTNAAEILGFDPADDSGRVC